MFSCSKVKSESQDSWVTSQDSVEHAQKMKRDLLEQLEELAEDLPPNTLDELIDELGGPENVAEVLKYINVFIHFKKMFVSGQSVVFPLPPSEFP